MIAYFFILYNLAASQLSGKQKYHTIKSQVLANTKSTEIICTSFSNGKTHDFSLFKKSKIGINKELELLGDKGY